MNKSEVIGLLRTGLLEALDLLEQMEEELNEQGPVNPFFIHKTEQLRQLIQLSGHRESHPLYNS